MISAMLAGATRLVSGAAVQWHCNPDAGAQRIYFANHSSHLDFIVIWSALPPRLRPFARPVAGRDYWERGAVRRYLASHVFRAVLVERGHAGGDDPNAAPCTSVAQGFSPARASVQLMAQEMGHRNSLIVFPEGTRSVNGEVGAFKSGLYHLARVRPDAELIPVHLENLNRILPKGEALPVPMLSRVSFGAPLRTIRDEDKQEFLTRARTALIQLRVTR